MLQEERGGEGRLSGRSLAIDQRWEEGVRDKRMGRRAEGKGEEARVGGKENIGNSIRSGATIRAPEYVSSSSIGSKRRGENQASARGGEEERNQQATEVITRFI